LIEAKTLLGVMPAADAIEALDAEIERVERRGGNYLWVESVAWLSIAGAMISLRHLDGRALQHRLAVYTHKALEFGDKLSNWAIKERVTTLEFLGRRAVGEKAGIDIDIVLDRDDRARIADLMARFPNFREDGWRLLETARFVN